MTKPENKRLNFGKYAGKKLKDVPQNYLKWLIGQRMAECIVHNKVVSATDKALIEFLSLKENILKFSNSL